MKPFERLGVFLLRNLLLYFLLYHAYLYFRGDLNLLFLSIGFVLAVVLALWMNRLRLRLWAACLLFVLTVVCLRMLFFLVFRLQILLSPGPHTDFLFFTFDKDFFPGLLPVSCVPRVSGLQLGRPFGLLFFLTCCFSRSLVEVGFAAKAVC